MERTTIMQKLVERKKMFEDYLLRNRKPFARAAADSGTDTDSGTVAERSSDTDLKSEVERGSKRDVETKGRKG